jgi:hypothetical protein
MKTVIGVIIYETVSFTFFMKFVDDYQIMAKTNFNSTKQPKRRDVKFVTPKIFVPQEVFWFACTVMATLFLVYELVRMKKHKMAL